MTHLVIDGTWAVGSRVLISYTPGSTRYGTVRWLPVRVGSVIIELDAEIEVVTCQASVSVPRCQCGSGNHTRGPGHSVYCQLYEAGP